ALVDEQLPAGQRDGLALQIVDVKGDGVATLRVGDLIAHRADRDRRVVQIVGDGQRAGHVAAFEDFDERPEAWRRASTDSPTPRRAKRRSVSQPGKQPHDVPLSKAGLRENDTAIRPGAQTERRGVGRRDPSGRVLETAGRYSAV